MRTGPISLGKWTSSTLTGWIAAIPLVGALALLGEKIGFGGARTFVALGVGAGFGIAQSLSNQRTPIGAFRWVWLSALGLAIPALLVDISRLAPLTDPYPLHAAIGVGGLTIGLAQFTHLRRYFVTPVSWIIASALGWAAFALASGSADILVRRHALAGVSGAGIYLGLIAAGAIALGVVTGFAMERLRPRAT